MLSYFIKVDNENLFMNLNRWVEVLLSANTTKSALSTVFFGQQEVPLSDNVLVHQQNLYMQVLDKCYLYFSLSRFFFYFNCLPMNMKTSTL